MLRDRFFALIDAARQDTAPTGPSADADALAEVLTALDDEELTGYMVAFDDELIRLNRWDVWGAGYVAEGGMSDDAFHYFRAWLVGKGSAVVDAVLVDPDSLAAFLEPGIHENEELEYVGRDLLEERGLPDPVYAPGRANADDDPAGDPFDEDTVQDEYPRIAAAVA